MKKTLSLILAVVVLVTGLAACGGSGRREQDLAAMEAAGIPQELLMEGVKADVGGETIQFDIKKPYAEVKAYYDSYLTDHAAEETIAFDTKTMVEQGMYPQQWADEGMSAWTYQGTVDGDKPIYLMLTEQKIQMSTFTGVYITYGQSVISFSGQESLGEFTVDADGNIVMADGSSIVVGDDSTIGGDVVPGDNIEPPAESPAVG